MTEEDFYMKVRFKTAEDALSAKEKTEKHLENIEKILKADEQNGWGNDPSHLFFLSCKRIEKTLLNKINAWQEDQQSRLAKNEKEQFAKKCKWSPTSRNNHVAIRKARRDKQRYREALSVEMSENDSSNKYFDPLMHALECSECDRENYYWAEDRLADYNDENNYHEVYQGLRESGYWLQSSNTHSEPQVQEEDSCYECSGPCVVYVEECSSLYDVNNDMRDQDYHTELDREKIIGQLAKRYSKSNQFDYSSDTYESDARIDSSYFIG